MRHSYAGAARTSDAMNEILGLLRQIVVHAVSELAECRIDLNGEFACGAEDQDLDCFGARNGGESFNQGIENARVLPVPVCAVATTSRPCMRGDGLRLDGRWSDEFVLIEVVL